MRLTVLIPLTCGWHWSGSSLIYCTCDTADSHSEPSWVAFSPKIRTYNEQSRVIQVHQSWCQSKAHMQLPINVLLMSVESCANGCRFLKRDLENFDLCDLECDDGCRYLKCDLENFDLRDLECKFDVMLIEPPLEEYQRTMGVTHNKYWDWNMVITALLVFMSEWVRHHHTVQFTLVHAGKYRTEDTKSKTDTTKTKHNPVNNTRYSKTNLAWFCSFLRHSARKWGGLILRHSWAHTGHYTQTTDTDTINCDCTDLFEEALLCVSVKRQQLFDNHHLTTDTMHHLQSHTHTVTRLQSSTDQQHIKHLTSVAIQPSDVHCCHMGTAIKHPVPDWFKPSFAIFDIWALWRSALSVRVPICQKLQMTA